MPRRYVTFSLAVKGSSISEKTTNHPPESRSKRGISAFDAPICYSIPFHYFPDSLPCVPTLPVTCPERMVVSGNDWFPETLGFETDNIAFKAIHDSVAFSEPSFLSQDVISGSYLPDRFQPFGSENQRISIKAGKPACKDIYLSFPVPEIGCGNVCIALSIWKPII